MRKSLLILTMLSGLVYAGGENVVVYQEPEMIPIPMAIPVAAVAAPVTESIPAILYVGVGFAIADFTACKDEENPDCGYEDTTYGAMLRIGYDYNEYVGVEGRWMRTFLDEGPLGGVPLQHYGLFLKPQYPATEDFNIYGLLGYGYTESLGNGNRLRYFVDGSGFSAGIGGEYNFTDEIELFADYQRLLITSEAPDMNTFHIGLRFNF